MVVVTGREFRASQAKYFDFANEAEDVTIICTRVWEYIHFSC